MPRNTTASNATKITNLERYAKAYRALLEKRYVTAIHTFPSYIEHGGTQVVRACYHLADAYIKDSHFIVPKSPHDPQKQQKHYEYQKQLMGRARYYLDRAIELKDDFIDAYIMRAEYWKFFKEEDKAKIDFEKAAFYRKKERAAANMRENSVLDHIREASRLIKTDPPLYEQAIAHIRTRILKDNPDSIEGNLHLAFIYTQWGISHFGKDKSAETACYNQATHIYKKVLMIDPGNAEASEVLMEAEISILLNQQKWAEAITIAQRKLQKHPADSMSNHCMADVYHTQGNYFKETEQLANAVSCYNKAISYYEVVRRKDPTNKAMLSCLFSSHEGKVHALCAQKKWPDAISYLKKRVITNNHDAIENTYLLGVVYYKQGTAAPQNYEKAISHFSEVTRYYEIAHQKNPGNMFAYSDILANTYYYKSVALVELGNAAQCKFAKAISYYDGAINFFKKALRINPTLASEPLFEAYLGRATAHYQEVESTTTRRKGMDAAISWINNSVIKKEPNSLDGYTILETLCVRKANEFFGASHYWDAIYCYENAIMNYKLIPDTCPDKEMVIKNLFPVCKKLITACEHQMKLPGNDKIAVLELKTKIENAKKNLQDAIKSSSGKDSKAPDVKKNIPTTGLSHATIAAHNRSPIYSSSPAASTTAASTTVSNSKAP